MKFADPPNIKLSDIRKSLGRFKMGNVSARITVPVFQKKGSFWAGDTRLSNPPRGKGFKDVLGQIKASWKRGNPNWSWTGSYPKMERGTRS